MRRGLAPKKLNKKTGQVESYHLHHKVYRCRGGSNAESNLVRMFRSNHIAYHKKYGYK